MTALDDRFLLSDDVAHAIYETGRDQPIVDFHSHLDAGQLAADQPVGNLADVWLGDDHYKWRIMRACGIDESLITGEAPGYDRFVAYCGAVSRAIGNPVQEWSHLELRRYFGIEAPLAADTAQAIWDRANELLSTPEFLPRNIVRRSGVEVLVTTDDPLADLDAHRRLAAADPGFRVLPGFRPDAFLAIDDPGFTDYLDHVADLTGRPVESWATLVAAIRERMEHFHAHGCRLSDHGLDTYRHVAHSPAQAEATLRRRLSGAALTAEEVAGYQTALLGELAAANRDLGWAAQIHFGAARRQNLPMTASLGPNTGFDSVGTQADIVDQLRRLLQDLHASGRLPKLVLFPLNPSDWLPVASLVGNFQGEHELQLGAAWWFNDSVSGIHHQLEVFATQGVLGNFVGMLTDSRSLLSYPRHEYFRRILASHIAGWVKEGRVHGDLERIAPLYRDICYHNAKSYFGI